MGTIKSLRIAVFVAALGAFSIASAQTQNQNSQNQGQTQAQPNQTSTQTQAQPGQAQPQTKQTLWQRLKQSAQQGMQNTTQQGTQQVQQGVQGVTNTVQQGTQSIQQGAQQIVPTSGSGITGSGGGNSTGSCGATCFAAGPFLANVSQMTMSQQGAWHVLRMEIQFQNATNQPLIIAYHDGSMIMTDNNGNSYQGCGGNPGELQGMGIDRGASTDPQFTLNPGQTSSAMFCVARVRAANSPVGTGYAYNFTIDELQAQNGASAIALRSYNLNFPTLTPGTTTSLTSFGNGSPANAFTGTSTVPGAVTTGTVPTTAMAPATGTSAVNGVAARSVPVTGTVPTTQKVGATTPVNGMAPATQRLGTPVNTAVHPAQPVPAAAANPRATNTALRATVPMTQPAAKPSPVVPAKPAPVVNTATVKKTTAPPRIQ